MFTKRSYLILLLLIALPLSLFGTAIAQDDMMDPPPGFDS